MMVIMSNGVVYLNIYNFIHIVLIERIVIEGRNDCFFSVKIMFIFYVEFFAREISFEFDILLSQGVKISD